MSNPVAVDILLAPTNWIPSLMFSCIFHKEGWTVKVVSAWVNLHSAFSSHPHPLFLPPAQRFDCQQFPSLWKVTYQSCSPLQSSQHERARRHTHMYEQENIQLWLLGNLKVLLSTHTHTKPRKLFLCRGRVLPAYVCPEPVCGWFLGLPSLSSVASFVLENNLHLFGYFTFEMMEKLTKGRRLTCIFLGLWNKRQGERERYFWFHGW